MEERILDNRVGFKLREILSIAKEEFLDVIINLMKMKRQSTNEDG